MQHFKDILNASEPINGTSGDSGSGEGEQVASSTGSGVDTMPTLPLGGATWLDPK